MIDLLTAVLLALSLMPVILGMAVIQPAFATSATITIALNSVTSGSFATSSAIDNTSNKYVSALVQVKFKAGTTPTATGYVNVYLIRTADGGTTYDGNSTANKPGGMQFLGSMFLSGAVTGEVLTGTFDTALLGSLGEFWKIAVENLTGVTSDSTGGNHTAKFTGVTYTSA
jgi:hypothetical protein